MDKEEAIATLKSWEEDYLDEHPINPASITKSGIRKCFERWWTSSLVEELCRRIEVSICDPVQEIANYYYWIDNILADSDEDHDVTHRFAGFMSMQSHSILTFFRELEGDGHS